MLSAGPIPHNSMHLFIITTDFVALYRFTGYVVFIITSFIAGAESGDQCLNNSKVLSCFFGVIMSIRSVFLFKKVVSDLFHASSTLAESDCIRRKTRLSVEPRNIRIEWPQNLFICNKEEPCNVAVRYYM